MTNLRNKKYILVIAMALCLVMACSVSALATGADSPYITLGASFYANGKFNMSNGFIIINDANIWENLKIVASSFSDVNVKIAFITGVDTFYQRHVFSTDDAYGSIFDGLFQPGGGFGRDSSYGGGGSYGGGFGRNDAIEKFNNYQLGAFDGVSVQYITDESYSQVFCDFLGSPFLYVPDSSVKPTYNLNFNLQQSITNIAQNYFVSVTEQVTENTINNFYKEIQNIVNEEITQYITEVYNNTDNSTTIEKQIIDPVTNQFYDYSNNTTYDIEGFTYDIDDRSYTLSVSKDDYYYDYSVTYYNEYTYIIYLGSSESYQPEAYKIYYELPDGRSSADLTADELSGMSIEFNDVVTYDRVPSDEIVKGLFHLDGDLDNSTVYDGVEMFFTSGASITYQEAPNFNGALYLPALSGARQIIMPLHDTSKSDLIYSSNQVSQYIYTSDGNRNFAGMPFNSPYSIDFRFYSYADKGDTSAYLNLYGYNAYASASGSNGQAVNPSTPIFTLNGNSVVFNGRGFGNNNSTQLSVSVSVGTWNHILINFEPYLDYDGYRYRQTCYLNGVLIGSVSARMPTIPESALNRAMLLGFNMRSSSNTVPFMLDEFRITSANVPNLVSPVPYEDNLVWVLPDSDNLLSNTLAIQADYLSGKYRVGGIRPSMVEKGHVWFQIENNRIISCQVYNGIMWEAVNCYVWTGSRWIPANYYDVITLTDYYDIADNTGLPTITSSEGFFSWFQREFKEFKDAAINFFEAWENGGSGGDNITNNSTTIIAPSLTVNGTIDATISQNNNYEFDLGTDAGELIQNGFDGVSGVFRGAWGLLGGFVAGIAVNVTNFFDFYDTNGLYNNSINGGDNIWD